VLSAEMSGSAHARVSHHQRVATTTRATAGTCTHLWQTASEQMPVLAAAHLRPRAPCLPLDSPSPCHFASRRGVFTGDVSVRFPLPQTWRCPLRSRL
jgi:hypothetical protein